MCRLRLEYPLVCLGAVWTPGHLLVDGEASPFAWGNPRAGGMTAMHVGGIPSRGELGTGNGSLLVGWSVIWRSRDVSSAWSGRASSGWGSCCTGAGSGAGYGFCLNPV